MVDDVYKYVSVGILPDTIGPKPSKEMIYSVGELGVLVPILIHRVPQLDPDLDDRFRIIDGNRRVAAARAAGVTRIPSIIMNEVSRKGVAKITLLANGMRSENPIAETYALWELEGMSEDAVRRTTGLSKAQYAARSRLLGLEGEFIAAFEDGRVSLTALNAAAGANPDAKAILLKILLNGGKFVKADVDNAIRDTSPPPPEVTAEELIQRREIAYNLNKDELLGDLGALVTEAVDLGQDIEELKAQALHILDTALGVQGEVYRDLEVPF